MRTSLFASSFLAGFASLALEILCPRVLSALFGSTNMLWAAGITTTLGGLSVGCWLGGIAAGRGRSVLGVVLLAAAACVAAAQPLCAWTARAIDAFSLTALFTTCFLALFPASLFLGMVPPLVLERLTCGAQGERSRLIGRALALGTIGSLCGAWFAAFPGVQWIGIGTSLRLVAVALVVLALLGGAHALAGTGVVALALLLRPPGGPGELEGFDLVHERETSYQSVSVYESKDRREVIMAFGPTCQSRYDRARGAASSPYAAVMSSIVQVERPKNALVVGGAGNALALEMERRGIAVTVIEIDPVVAELTAEYFGAIRGETIVSDGRTAARWRKLSPFDLVLVDAFTGPGIVPPHLVTLECFREFRGLLTPDGLFALNVHAAPRESEVFDVLSSTLQGAFPNVRFWPVQEYAEDSRRRQNVWFLASDRPGLAHGMPCPPPGARLALDDRNPLEVLMFAELDRHWSGASLTDLGAALANQRVRTPEGR